MKKLVLVMMLISGGAFAECTPDMPGYYKEWIAEGLTPCDWAGYECTDYENCMLCNALVIECAI